MDAAGRTRNAHDAYRLLHAREEPHYLRATLEEGLFLGLGVTWYWLDRQNRADWDFPSFSERFSTDVLRFDNNTFPINFLWHPLSGAGYYHAGRANQLSLWSSIALSALTSTAWEYGIEFREKVSINDLVTTPVAGVAVGEFWSRLTFYASHPVSSHARGRKAYAYSFGVLQTIHDRIDHTRVTGFGPADDLGYSSDLWHRFYAGVGAGLNADRNWSEQATLSFAMEGSLVAIPSYLRPGRFRAFLHDADVTRLRFHAMSTRDAEGEVDLFSDVILAGYYTQDISDAGVGGSMLVGTGVGYRYRRVRFEHFDDDLSLTHMPGLSIEADALFSHAGVHLSARAGPDFAGLRGWAFDAWQRDHPDERTKTVLERAGYSYGFGGSGELGLELSVRNLRLGTRAFVGRFASTNGLDRNQEALTTDVKTRDLVLDTESYARLYPFDGHGYLVELSLLTRKRVSEVDEYERRGRLLRAGLALGAEF